MYIFERMGEKLKSGKKKKKKNAVDMQGIDFRKLLAQKKNIKK